mmetsp:Transcript_19292/g.28542  ORF Transcript_19292/g.28542 Transcript_19292/m.28542 type:complete len:260 (+) Transcript_19292:113-892(+)
MFDSETDMTGKESDYDDEDDKDYAPSSDDERIKKVSSKSGAKKRSKKRKTQTSAKKKRTESSDTSKRKSKMPVGRKESTSDDNGNASGSREEEKSSQSKRNRPQKTLKRPSSGKSSTGKMRKTKRNINRKEELSHSSKTITYGIRSKVRAATTNLAHPCATKRPWKWNACNECIACLKTNDCGKCGQCLAELPCILRQCITPIRADTSRAASPEDDNESLSSMESDVSDLEWEDVVPESHFGKISPNDLWKTWFSSCKE